MLLLALLQVSGDRQLLALADSLRDEPAIMARLCPDVGVPKQGGMRDLMQALALGLPIRDELPELNRQLRRIRLLEDAAARSRDPAAALAYLRAADKVIQVDNFPA